MNASKTPRHNTNHTSTQNEQRTCKQTINHKDAFRQRSSTLQLLVGAIAHAPAFCEGQGHVGVVRAL